TVQDADVARGGGGEDVRGGGLAEEVVVAEGEQDVDAAGLDRFHVEIVGAHPEADITDEPALLQPLQALQAATRRESRLAGAADEGERLVVGDLAEIITEALRPEGDHGDRKVALPPAASGAAIRSQRHWRLSLKGGAGAGCEGVVLVAAAAQVEHARRQVEA